MVRFASRWLLAALCSIASANAQTTSAPPASLEQEKKEADVVVLEKMKVEGFRQGLAKAREDQRKAANLKDIMSVDAAGKLPDSNVAEALQRLPSAYLVYHSRGGDGRYISVRGIDPVLNNLTLNGLTIAVPDVDARSGRAAPLDVMSASSLQSIEIIKSATPDMDGQGLGATINIVSPSAYTHQGPYAYGSAKMGFNDNQYKGGDITEWDVNFGATFGSHKQFGLIIGANYSFKDYNGYEVSREGWRVFGRNPNEYFNTAGAPNPFGIIAVSENMTMRSNFGYKEKKGGNFNFQWKPDADTEVWVRGFKTDYLEHDHKTQLRLRTSNLAAATTRFTSPTEMFTTRGAVETETEDGDATRPVDQMVIGGRKKLGDWTIDGDFNVTKAGENKPGSTLLAEEFSNNNFRNNLGNIPSNAAYAISTSDFWPIYRTVYNDPVNGWPGKGDIGDLTFYPFTRLRHEFSTVKERTKTYDLNAQWERDIAGLPGFIKTGVKFIDRAKSVDRNSRRYNPVTPFFLSDYYDDGTTRLPYGINNAELVGRYPLGPQTGPNAGLYARYLGATDNVPAFVAEFNRNIGSAADTQYDPITNTPAPSTLIKSPTKWVFDGAGGRSDSVQDDYTMTEKIFAYYLMGNYQVTKTAKVVAGARVEQTKGKMSAFVQRTNSTNGGALEIVPNGPVDVSFTHVLPALHVYWEATKKILVRGSVTTSIGRPDYRDMAPIGTLTINNGVAPNIFSGALNESNPSLKPYEALNYDLSAAYYFDKGRGMLSVGAFYKDIKNAIYPFNYSPLTDNISFAGKEYTLATVNGVQIVNFRGYQFSSLTVSTKNNSPKSHIDGLEFTYQHDFTFLPPPFDGLGVVVNFALMDSASTLNISRPTGANEVPFVRQPDKTYNVQLYYQRRGFEARIAWHAQGDALSTVGADPLLDKFWRATSNFDGKVSYQINRDWGIYVEGRNLTNEPIRTFFAFDRNALGGMNSEPGYAINGRTVYFGLNYRFGN